LVVPSGDGGAGSLTEAGALLGDASIAPPPVQCSGKTMPALGTQKLKIKVGNGEREYYIHVPAGYDPTRATQLIFTFHGFSSNASEQLEYTKQDVASDAHNFLVVSPQGIGIIPSWNAGGCCGEATIWQSDDVGFTRALLAEMRQTYCIDDARVYATGMSNGSFMAHRVACEMADQIAAIGAVSGGLMYKDCNPSRPVSVLAFHGTNDYTVPYTGGTIMGFGPILDTIASWVKFDGCTGEPQVTFQKGEVTCRTYNTCTGGNEITLCTIDGKSGTHSWPGADHHPVVGDANQDINATNTILDFFNKHHR
jgi:polyhydroxybutyrate depolymerase